jgi:hypothetical protein
MKWLTNSIQLVRSAHQENSSMPAEARKSLVRVAVVLVIAACGGPLLPSVDTPPAPAPAKLGFDPSRLRRLAVLLAVIAALSVLFVVGGGV